MFGKSAFDRLLKLSIDRIVGIAIDRPVSLILTDYFFHPLHLTDWLWEALILTDCRFWRCSQLTDKIKMQPFTLTEFGIKPFLLTENCLSPFENARHISTCCLHWQTVLWLALKLTDQFLTWFAIDRLFYYYDCNRQTAFWLQLQLSDYFWLTCEIDRLFQIYHWKWQTPSG